jgi:hypothetical protein
MNAGYRPILDNTGGKSDEMAHLDLQKMMGPRSTRMEGMGRKAPITDAESRCVRECRMD